MTAGIARILELHEPADFEDGSWPTCIEDGHVWPCPTYSALFAVEDAS